MSHFLYLTLYLKIELSLYPLYIIDLVCLVQYYILLYGSYTVQYNTRNINKSNTYCTHYNTIIYNTEVVVVYDIISVYCQSRSD